MKPTKLPMRGSCRCGEVTFEIGAPPLMTAVCHCTGCQRMSGSAFSLTATVPADAFTVTQGEPVIGGLRGPELHHYCCPSCMSWMFTRIEGAAAIVNIRPTLLDDASWFVPFIETMTKEKLSWVDVPARHRFEGFPAVAERPGLIAAFAAAID